MVINTTLFTDDYINIAILTAFPPHLALSLSFNCVLTIHNKQICYVMLCTKT